MSIHTSILPRVLEQVRRADPGCGVVLFGSVAEGTERPSSDLDLFAIGRECTEIRFADSAVIHEENGMRLVRGHVEGVTVDVACWPVEALEKALSATPYLFYPISQGRPVHDPDGLAERYLRVMRDYFRESPATAHLWAQQLEDLKRNRRDPRFELKFAEWGRFVEHLGEMIEGGELPRRDGDGRATHRRAPPL